MMEECFRDIHNIGTGYERAKGYCRDEFNTPETRTVLHMWRTPLTFQMHRQQWKQQQQIPNQTHTWQNQKGNNYTHKFWDNENKNNMFLTGTLSFQTNQQIRLSSDMLAGIDMIKSFWVKIGGKCSSKNKSDSQHESPNPKETSANEVMQTIMAGKNDPPTQDPIGNATKIE